MEEAKKENETTGLSTEKNGSSKKLKIAFVLVILLLLAIIGGSAFLVNDQNQKLKVKDAKIALLETAPAVEGQYTDAEQATSSQSTFSCEGGSEYSAKIGKFSINLDSPRVIVRDLDDGFEGGPVTQLEIGNCLEGEKMVVDTPQGSEFTILAHPASSAADLKAAYESRNGTLTSDGTLTIAGVSADKYKLSALFESTIIYFDNNGIGYQIELANTTADTNATLNDVVDDWSFTP